MSMSRWSESGTPMSTARWLKDYWSYKTTTGKLCMPAIATMMPRACSMSANAVNDAISMRNFVEFLPVKMIYKQVV